MCHPATASGTSMAAARSMTAERENVAVVTLGTARAGERVDAADGVRDRRRDPSAARRVMWTVVMAWNLCRLSRARLQESRRRTASAADVDHDVERAPAARRGAARPAGTENQLSKSCKQNLPSGGVFSPTWMCFT